MHNKNINRKTKGLLGQAEVLAYMIRCGYSVFWPFDGTSPIDFVALKNSKLYKVFVRSTAYSETKTSSWLVELRNVSRRKNNKVVIKPFKKHHFDLVAVYIIPENRVVLIPTKIIRTASTLTIKRKVG